MMMTMMMMMTIMIMIKLMTMMTMTVTVTMAMTVMMTKTKHSETSIKRTPNKADTWAPGGHPLLSGQQAASRNERLIFPFITNPY